MTRTQKLLLVGIILLAIFFRFYLIKTMPGGLFPDEAANGLDINSMQQGHLQPFYERGNGREALFFYMLWGSIEVFGKGPWQHHIVPAIVGVLAIILTFLLTRRLFMLGEQDVEVIDGQQSPVLKRATTIALWAAFLMAVGSWYVVLNRTAFRANLIPLFSTLTFYLLLCTIQAAKTSKRYLFAFLTGAAFALGFYTYIAYRIMAPILVMLIGWPLLVDIFKTPRFEGIKKYFGPTIAFSLAFVIFIYPIGKYFYMHEGSFVGRSGQVSIFNPELNQGNLKGAIVEVTKLSILGYFTQGDLNWRHNVSGAPFLSQLVSPFFGGALIFVSLLGIGYFLMPNKRRSWWKYYLLTGWFWGMLLPVITTAEGIPHGLRSIGTIPPVYIISAIGLYWFAVGVKRLHNRIWNHYCGDNDCLHKDHDWAPFRKGLVEAFMKALVACFVVALVLQTYVLYFVYAFNSPENFYSFRSDLTPVSCYLTYYGDKNDTFLVLDKFSVQTPDYFTFVDGRHPENSRNNPYVQVDPEDSWKLPPIKPGQQVVFTQSSIFDITKFKQYHPEVHLVQETRNKFGQAVIAVYAVPNQGGKFIKKAFDYSNASYKRQINPDCEGMFGPNIPLYY